MNKQDKKLVDDFLTRTERKTKASPKKANRKPRLTKAERQELNKAYMREMIIDTIILAVVVILVVATLAWIVGKLNGQNC